MKVITHHHKKILYLALWGITFGFIEAAIVIYLRELYYPGGFSFPVVFADDTIATVEIIRELATLILIWATAALSYSSGRQRFAAFMILFGVWDIFYYIFLKLFLDWPASFFTWDILFLIPVPWVGPVLAPVIVSMIMITFALLTVYSKEKGYIIEANRIDFLFLSLACIIIFISFIWDFPRIIAHEMPSSFHWELFSVGGLYGISGFYRIYRRKI